MEKYDWRKRRRGKWTSMTINYRAPTLSDAFEVCGVDISEARYKRFARELRGLDRRKLVGTHK